MMSNKQMRLENRALYGEAYRHSSYNTSARNCIAFAAREFDFPTFEAFVQVKVLRWGESGSYFLVPHRIARLSVEREQDPKEILEQVNGAIRILQQQPGLQNGRLRLLTLIDNKSLPGKVLMRNVRKFEASRPPTAADDGMIGGHEKKNDASPSTKASSADPVQSERDICALEMLDGFNYVAQNLSENMPKVLEVMSQVRFRLARMRQMPDRAAQEMEMTPKAVVKTHNIAVMLMRSKMGVSPNQPYLNTMIDPDTHEDVVVGSDETAANKLMKRTLAANAPGV